MRLTIVEAKGFHIVTNVDKNRQLRPLDAISGRQTIQLGLLDEEDLRFQLPLRGPQRQRLVMLQWGPEDVSRLLPVLLHAIGRFEFRLLPSETLGLRFSKQQGPLDYLQYSLGWRVGWREIERRFGDDGAGSDVYLGLFKFVKSLMRSPYLLRRKIVRNTSSVCYELIIDRFVSGDIDHVNSSMISVAEIARDLVVIEVCASDDACATTHNPQV